MTRANVPATQQPGGLPAKPEFMQGREKKGMDEVKEYVSLPRIKRLQGLSDEGLLRDFGVGSVVVVPDRHLLIDMPRNAKTGDPLPDQAKPFQATPLFFFKEFVCWNPRKLKGQVPSIAERTRDPNHRIAKFAKDPNRRRQPYPDNPELFLSFQEHMNFILMVEGFAKPCIVSFEKSEFKTGRAFAALIDARDADIFACRFDFNVAWHSNTEGKWIGFEPSNPADGQPWVTDEARYAEYDKLHDYLAEKYQEDLLDVQYEEVVEGETIDVTSTAASM